MLWAPRQRLPVPALVLVALVLVHALLALVRVLDRARVRPAEADFQEWAPEVARTGSSWSTI